MRTSTTRALRRDRRAVARAALAALATVVVVGMSTGPAQATLLMDTTPSAGSATPSGSAPASATTTSSPSDSTTPSASATTTSSPSDVVVPPPVVTPPVVTPPVVTPPVVSNPPPVVTPPVVTPPVVSNPPPVVTPPVVTPPVVTPPVVTPPVASNPPPAVTPPAGTPQVVTPQGGTSQGAIPQGATPPAVTNPAGPPQGGTPQAVPHSAAPDPSAKPHPHKAPQVVRPHPHKSPMLTRPHPHQVPQFTDVVIATAPAVAGYPISVEGTTQLTDASGKVSFHTPLTSQALADRTNFAPATLTIDGRQVKVAPVRLYRYPSGPQLALDLSYPVSFQFSNVKALQGAPIDNLTVRSSTGQVATLPAGQTSWLEGARAVPQDAGLEVRTVDWSVQRVTYGGSNVVNESQQRFSPASRGSVDVALLFYSVRFHVSDALFGTVGAQSVDLTFPSGRTQRFALDSKGSLALPTLPRGDYKLTAVGAGPRVQLPLTISRNQTVNVGFFSWIDVATVVGAVLVLGALLAFAGRLRRRSRFVHRLAFRRGRRPVVLERIPRAAAQPADVHEMVPVPRSADDEPATLTIRTDPTTR